MSDLELLDCGGGRRLERFAAAIVDRPAPAADWIPRTPPAEWKRATLRWGKGGWVRGGTLRAVAGPRRRPDARVPARSRRPAGRLPGACSHVGVAGPRGGRCGPNLGRPPEVLSLFGYTGGASLACAKAGARVVHVDSSRPAVAWARRNAELSGLTEAPIRWLVEDARVFVRRERRRGNRYDGVVLDPPSYGHGNGAWQIEEHLGPLLADLAALVGPRPSFVLLSAHTEGFDADRLGALVREHFGVAAAGEPMMVVEPRRLPSAAGRVGAQPRPLKARMPLPRPDTRHQQPEEPAGPGRGRAPRDDAPGTPAGLTLVDGARELGRALDGGARVVEVFVDETSLTPDGASILERARAAGAAVVPVTRVVLDRLAYGDRSEGLVATVAVPDVSLGALHLPADPLVIVLEGVEKPGNLGAVLRSADGAGADAVIVADPRTDLFNPNAVRASLGSIFTVPIAAGSGAAVRDHLASAGLRVLAARVEGSLTYTEVDMRGPLAIVLGSEAAGLTGAWADEGVVPVRLPMLGVADSLNVSIAAAVFLYEARRQRGVP